MRINVVYIILLALTIMSSGIPASLAGVDGVWKINGFGADSMALTRAGDHVWGTYSTPQGQGTIDGCINAQNIWTGRWREPFNDDWGYFFVAFSNDSARLCGSWKYAQSDCGSFWYCNPTGGWDGYFSGEKQSDVIQST